MSEHIINGEFQSDKYPTCPRGKVPLSTKDTMAQDLLWEYAQRRRIVDQEFSDDLEECLRNCEYEPNAQSILGGINPKAIPKMVEALEYFSGAYSNNDEPDEFKIAFKMTYEALILARKGQE